MYGTNEKLQSDCQAYRPLSHDRQTVQRERKISEGTGDTTNKGEPINGDEIVVTLIYKVPAFLGAMALLALIIEILT